MVGWDMGFLPKRATRVSIHSIVGAESRRASVPVLVQIAIENCDLGRAVPTPAGRMTQSTKSPKRERMVDAWEPRSKTHARQPSRHRASLSSFSPTPHSNSSSGSRTPRRGITTFTVTKPAEPSIEEGTLRDRPPVEGADQYWTRSSLRLASGSCGSTRQPTGSADAMALADVGADKPSYEIRI
jgi:hypothetical protein